MYCAVPVELSKNRFVLVLALCISSYFCKNRYYISEETRISTEIGMILLWTKHENAGANSGGKTLHDKKFSQFARMFRENTFGYKPTSSVS
jgi:hypothetical protein